MEKNDDRKVARWGMEAEQERIRLEIRESEFDLLISGNPTDECCTGITLHKRSLRSRCNLTPLRGGLD